ncbi:hypothetical protein LTR17_022375 [Elasticomyces elasticus]|nr:hypothetical protein LTR17_022375 [Elasticomyces elasticus]
MSHKQSELEKSLRRKFNASFFASLRSDCTLVGLRETEDWTYATYVGKDGLKKEIRAKFLVGADGKTGFVGKNYLEPKGIRLLWAERPAVCGRFGPSSDMLWRFEFVVARDEDPTEMARPEKIDQVVIPYLRHLGSRYGLVSSIVRDLNNYLLG